MSEVFDRPLHGVAVYNPKLLSKEELIGFFVAREEELERLVVALRREAKAQPQHHLVVGSRGMGKTTLLHRLRYAIEDDQELGSRCLGLVFPEEQYNVVSLADFWLNCVDALADGLESSEGSTMVQGLDEEVEEIQASSNTEERGRRALELLCRLSDRLGRRLILLVDNVDIVLDRLDDEQWALREVLSSEKRIQLIGATSAPLESHYQHDKAFYDFFRVHHLEGLDDEATFKVLRRLAELTGHERVTRLLDDEPSRVRTVRLMAGGNPRTVVLLFSVLAQGTDGDVRADLERLLDLCTPLYKHRLEVLPTQAQQVLDALAKHWSPATAAEIAGATHLDVNLVSTQLSRLVKDGTVEKVQLPDTKRYGFQIAERFFNIWCLMRASRRVRRRLVWLVEFLRLMFGAEDLAERARRHLATEQPIDALRRAELGLAFADVVGDTRIRTALEIDSIRALCVDPLHRTRLDELFDLQGRDQHLVGYAERMSLLEDARRLVLAADIGVPGWDRERVWTMLAGSPNATVRGKHEAATTLYEQASAINELHSRALHHYFDAIRASFLPGEFESLSCALRDGQIAIENLTRTELESAKLILHSPSLAACALCMGSRFGISVDFEEFGFEIQNSRSILPWLMWAYMAHTHGVSSEEITRSVLGVLQCHAWNGAAMVEVGSFLKRHPGVFEGIETAYAGMVTAETQDLMLDHAFLTVIADDWDNALKWFVFSLEDPHGRFIDQNWRSVLAFFLGAVARGFTTNARALLASIGTSERWEPLDRALEVVERDDASILDRMAPEMREAVRLVLAQIAPKMIEEPPLRSTRRPRRAATKKT
jgi:hypothetical protein